MPPSVIVIADETSADATVAEQAVRAIWPKAALHRVVRWAGIAEAAADPGVEIVIDCRPDLPRPAGEANPEGEPDLSARAFLRRGSRRNLDLAHAVTVEAADWNVSTLSALLPVLLEAQRLRRENEQFRGDLKAIAVRVAHDLRSPVNGIVSAIDLVNDALARVAPAGTGATATLQESTEELSRLVGQLALWTRLSAARVEPRSFAMEEAVRRAREKYEARAALAGATLTAVGRWPSVLGDPEITEMVWRALIDNGLRHAGKNPRIELGWDDAGEGFRFWVRDNGQGVEPRKIGGLFHPIHRLHEPNAPRGFGLPIVERLMRLQGGHCDFEANDAGGATFRFYLPAGR